MLIFFSIQQVWNHVETNVWKILQNWFTDLTNVCLVNIMVKTINLWTKRAVWSDGPKCIACSTCIHICILSITPEMLYSQVSHNIPSFTLMTDSTYYILWKIHTTKSTFDVVIILKRLTVKHVPINNYKLLYIQVCSVNLLWNMGSTQILVVS